MTADEVSLLSRQLAESDVEDLLCAYRLPTVHEVVLVAESLGMTLDVLLGIQRVTHPGTDEAN